MKQLLRNYKLKITALSPIFIGDGGKIGKKEYIYLPREKKALIPDMEKMYRDLRRTRKDRDYIQYMMESTAEPLGLWLKNMGYRPETYSRWKKYELYTGDSMLKNKMGKDVPPKEIATFVKDPYGLPYVPGSSLKGMIRTALMAYEIGKDPDKYKDIKQDISENVKIFAKRPLYMARETKKLESCIFNRLNREPKKVDDAVNSILSGMIVSDSQPIPVEQLILSQKIDYTLKGEERPFPILRESLKPGTEIVFQITLHEDFPYTIEEVMKALEYFQKICYHYFYSRFHRGTTEKGVVWLGGGVGFLSKTVVYALYGSNGFIVADAVFKNTLGKLYDVHKHNRDKGLKLSPHVCKCTRYHGRLYDVGMGKIEVIS